MERWLRGLGALALALSVILLTVFYRQVPRAKKPFDKVRNYATRLQMAQGVERLELIKQGSDWQVRAGGAGTAHPADSEKLRSLLATLSNIQVEDVISDRADRAATFEVDEASGTRVKAFDAKGKGLGDGIFGKQSPDFAHLYFRYPDRPDVYLARGAIRGELGTPSVNEWRRKDLMAIPETDIRQITLTSKGQTLDLVRSSETWTANGKKANAGPIYGLIGTLAHLRADDFLDDPAGHSFDAATIVVKGAKESVTLRLGAPTAKPPRVPVSLDPGGAFWIGADKAKALLLTPKDLASQ